MKRFLILLTLFLAPSVCHAQCNGVFSNNTVCGNISGGTTTPRQVPVASLPLTVGPNSVTNSQLAQMPADTVKCNPTGSTANAQDCTNVPLIIGGLGGSQAGATANQIPVYPGSSGAAVPTTVGGSGGLFDTICSSTVGQVWTRLTSGWGCTSLGYANPVWWGADPTGSADSTSAFNSALAASNLIVFPPGTFKFSSAIAPTLANGASLAIRGAGQDVTNLYWTGASSGITVSYGNQFSSFHLANVTIMTDSTAGTNIGVFLQQLVSNPPAAFAAPNSFDHVTFRGHDGYGLTDYWEDGIFVSNVSVVNFYDVVYYGSSTSLGNGVSIQGDLVHSSYAVQFSFINSTFNLCNVGIAHGSWIQGLFVTASNFVQCNYGVLVTSGNLGVADEIAITASQFNCAIGELEELTNVNSTSLTNNLFIVNANENGATIASQGWTVVGNVFAGASLTNSTGAFVAGVAGSGFGVITGNAFFDLGTGVAINNSATSTGVNVQSNAYHGNTTNVINAGVGNTIGGGSQ